jgi:hypothetical protein
MDMEPDDSKIAGVPEGGTHINVSGVPEGKTAGLLGDIELTQADAATMLEAEFDATRNDSPTNQPSNDNMGVIEIDHGASGDEDQDDTGDIEGEDT